jgi:6-pyruvoyltetrahydropterin/6-carboxytetrahydropterin synthase
MDNTNLNEITRFITFDMAHRLPNHCGRCSNIHGHTWKIGLTVEGTSNAIGSSEGMVFDYKDLKQWLMEVVDKNFDHSLTLYYDDPYVLDIVNMYGIKEQFDSDMQWLDNVSDSELSVINYPEHRFNICSFIPTSENLASYFKYEFKQRSFSYLEHHPTYNGNVKVKSVELWETPNSRCIV